MKKAFALLMAAVMTISTASVALASYVPDDTDIYISDEGGSRVFVYNDDTEQNELVDYSTLSTIKPDTYVYIEILGDASENSTTVNRYRAFADWKVGSPGSTPTIEYVRVVDGNGTRSYIYAYTFKTPDINATSYDLAGSLSVARTASAARNTDDTFEFDITVAYNTYEEDGSGSAYVTKETPVVVFSSNTTEVDIEIGDDVALFTVNAAGQSRVNLLYNTKFDAEFAALYPEANLDFLTFSKNPTFNRNGQLYIYADEDTYLYGVSANGAVELEATYDTAYGAWVMTTRTLGSYVLSDRELDTNPTGNTGDNGSDSGDTDNTDNSSSTSAPSEDGGDTTLKPNPNTGR